MLMHTTRSWKSGGLPTSNEPLEPSLLTLSALLGVVRRHRILLAVTPLVIIVLAASYAFTTRPMYSAAADVIIDARNARVIEPNNVSVTPTQLGLEAAAIESQVQILKSEELAIKVIKAWKLDQRPEFTQPRSLMMAWLGAAMQQLRSVLSFGNDSIEVKAKGIPRDVIDEFAKRLTIKRADETYVINIRFDAEERKLAADIANAVASAYLDEQLDARFDSIKRASTWLEARKDELRQLANAADLAVQKYKADNGIQITGSRNGFGDAQAQLLSDTRLSKADADLAEARRDTDQKQARYDQIMRAINAGDLNFSVPEAQTSEVITRLRLRISENLTRLTEFTKRYGPNHEAVQRLIADNRQLSESVTSELGRIAQSYLADLETAKGRQAAAVATRDQLNLAATEMNVTQVKLRELEREAQTYQNLYQSFSDRYATAIQQQSFPITEARVLTEASEPREKSAPKTGLILILAAFGGTMLGFGLAILMDMTDSAFRTPADVEAKLQISCLGVLPKLSDRMTHNLTDSSSTAREPGTLPADLGILSYVATAPLSRFAETLRAVKVAADLASLDGKMKVIGVVSSIPDEGKSTVSMNLAQLIAMSGKSVLLIDGDLRNPSLSDLVAPKRNSGLLEYLVDGSTVSQSILVDPTKPLSFLPANGGIRVPQTAELMGSAQMERLIAALSNTYDFVVIDLPPLAPVVDVRVIARLIQGFVYVVEWGQTSEATVQQAMQTVPSLHDKLLGVVLNKTNMQALRLYSKNESGNEYYDYNRFGAYAESH